MLLRFFANVDGYLREGLYEVPGDAGQVYIDSGFAIEFEDATENSSRNE